MRAAEVSNIDFGHAKRKCERVNFSVVCPVDRRMTYAGCFVFSLVFLPPARGALKTTCPPPWMLILLYNDHCWSLREKVKMQSVNFSIGVIYTKCTLQSGHVPAVMDARNYLWRKNLKRNTLRSWRRGEGGWKGRRRKKSKEITESQRCGKWERKLEGKDL